MSIKFMLLINFLMMHATSLIASPLHVRIIPMQVTLIELSEIISNQAGIPLHSARQVVPVFFFLKSFSIS